MVLDWQTLPVPFQAGLDTKSHPAHVPVGSLTRLENGVFNKTGAIDKRNGHTPLPTQILGTADGRITNAFGSAVYNGKDLLAFDGNNVYSYIPSMESWANKGSCTAIDTTYKNIVSNSYEQANVDVAILNGVELYAWDDSRGGIRYSMIDQVTGAQLITDQLLTLTGSNPKCLAFGTYLLVLFHTSTHVQAALIPPAYPENVIFYFLASNAASNGPYDAVVTNFTESEPDGYLFVTGQTNVGTTVVKAFKNDMLQYWSSTVATNSANCLTAFPGIKGLWVGAGSGDRMTAFQVAYADGSTTVAPTILDFLNFPSTIKHVTGIELSANAVNNAVFFWDTTNDIDYIRYAILHDGGTITKVADYFKRAVSLVSKCWFFNGRLYLNVVFDSTLQPTYFTLNDLGEVVAKEQMDLAGGVRFSYSLSEVIYSSNKFYFANERRGAVQSNNGVVYSLRGASSSTLNFSNKYKTAMLGNSLHIAGGVIQAYDGARVVEHNFHLFPEDVIGFPAAIGDIDNGDHSWIFTYEWTDNLGKVERSAPSIPISANLNLGTNSVTFFIPALTLTKKENVRIVCYRTRAATTGDPLYYRVSTVGTPTLNDPLVQYVEFTDLLSDADIDSNPVLYCSPDTNGIPIEVENQAAPQSSIIATYKNRIFLSGLDDANQSWFSKTVVPGEPTAFSDAFTIDVDAKGGSITGLAVLDSTLIIFKENCIYSMSGAGPTNTGAQNDFVDAQMVASDVGCINQNSICLVSSLGIFFQSSKGIYLLDRGFGCQYIGAPVEDFNGQTITAAVQVPGSQEVRFLCSDGNALVYNYYYLVWSTFTNHLAVDGGVWGDSFYFIGGNGVVHVETPEVYQDGNNGIEISVTTGWLSLAGLQNYTKFRSFLLLGDYHGVHQLEISVAYDGRESFTDSVVIDTRTLFDINIYGQQNVYGQNSPYGGTFSNEQFRIFIKQQRCQRIKIRISEKQIQGLANQGLTLVGLLLQVGAKRGAGKIKPGQQFGVK